MGDKEFHEMLGILCDYDDLINKIGKEERNGLINLASKYEIKLDEADINDLLTGLDGIKNMKNNNGSCFYASPRN
jgi:hypothetical protein